MSKMSEVTIELNGQKKTLSVGKDETILDVCLKEDVNAPYSCMSGSCTACLAELISGTVEMDYADALTEDELKEGKILTCQAKPTSDKVEIKYP
ncbi:MAG: 2Fe-2S iron-sulfur cluster-binding protein [Bdellovibrionales bacterium]